jgi:hypothetical protein
MLEPLKDLRLKHPWDLMIIEDSDGSLVSAFDPIFKEAGFDCVVRRYARF